MTTLSRVQERIETDLTGTELQSMIDEVEAEIERRFGVQGSIIVFQDGDRKYLSLIRESGTITSIKEILGTTETTLETNDYRILDGGRTLERLGTGTNGRLLWEKLVKVTYVPASKAEEREEVVIQVVQLGVEYKGLRSEKSGDYTVSFADYKAERDTLIGALTPRRGMVMA